MLPAVQPGLASLNVEHRSPCAGVMRAMLASDTDHVLFSVLSAVHRRLGAADIEVR